MNAPKRRSFTPTRRLIRSSLTRSIWSSPVRRPDGPGQFAFADPHHVRQILSASGWSDINMQAIDARRLLPHSQLSRYVGKLGPLGQALPHADEQTRVQVLEKVLEAFEPYV